MQESNNSEETGAEKPAMEDAALPSLRQRASTLPESTSTLETADISVLNEATTSMNSVNFQAPAHIANISILDQHRSLIIMLVVMAIGLLVLRRLILI